MYETSSASLNTVCTLLITTGHVWRHAALHWVQVVLYKLVLCISLTNENLSEEPLMCQLHKRAGTYTYVYIYSQICHIYVYVYICVWMLFHN